MATQVMGERAVALPGAARLGEGLAAVGLATVADRLAHRLMRGGAALSDGPLETGHPAARIAFVDRVEISPLPATAAPIEVWAVDGGQATVADARCLSVIVARASRVRFGQGRSQLEDPGALHVALLGNEDDRVTALRELEIADLSPSTPVDINLWRDAWEWASIASTVAEALPGALVLVDGDLSPDWRLPSRFLADVLDLARRRGVFIAGVTKHTALARGGAPLLAQLEREATATLGPRARWLARVGRTRDDAGGVTVSAARLDPQAPFSFRVDVPEWADPGAVLAMVAAVSDDAGFPGYPYPLTVADRLAACPAWVRRELRHQLDELLAAAEVSPDVRERAFADRHSLMERF